MLQGLYPNFRGSFVRHFQPKKSGPKSAGRRFRAHLTQCSREAFPQRLTLLGEFPGTQNPLGELGMFTTYDN